MFSKSFSLFVWSALLLTSEQALGREQILERDGRAVYLYPRRFGQEQPAVLQKIRDACGGAVCGNLAGQAVTPLLAAQPECSQQDMADAIIDASKQFDAATAALMVAAAIEYRQVEKNTPPDFTTNPPSLRNSVFCQKAPKNSQLNGLVQAQDPSNDPDLFFDPATKATVRKGTQANTSPFGGAVAQPAPTATQETDIAIETEAPTATDCPDAVTVTVTGTVTATPTNAVTVVVGDASSTAAAPTATAATPGSTVGTADFGSCTVPQIEFGAGFEGRRETSFQPTDKQSFNHGSAQNIAIITQFICDTLTNSCKANQDAKTLCATASTAATGAAAKTGAQADAFNSVFGIKTDFASVVVIDDQGRVVGAASTAPASSSPVATLVATKVVTTAPAASTTAAAAAGNGAIGNFGKCTVPQIEFAAGFDNRRETSFRPIDRVSYNHGSAQNIDIITQFICDTLTNTCAADQTAKNTCATARTAASAAAKGTGAQADAFNKVFGISTQFSSVTQIDNTGKVVGGSAAAPAPATVAPPSTASSTTVIAPPTAAPAAGNLQNFTEALGGVVAPTVTALGNGQFQVSGNAAFNNQTNAVVRSCDVQNNQCANAANASGNKNGFTVAACNAQQAKCIAAAN